MEPDSEQMTVWSIQAVCAGKHGILSLRGISVRLENRK